VTVCFNAEDSIEETLSSLQEQSCRDFQYIVVDGMSTDRTLDLLNTYDLLIDELISERDSGIYDAMNKGLKIATGRYIYFLNAGDRFADQWVLADIKKKIESDGLPQILVGNLLTQKGVTKPEPRRLAKTLIRRVLPHQAIFIETACHGVFDFGFRIAADFDKLLELTAISCEAVYIDRNIAFYDVIKRNKTPAQRRDYDLLRCQEKESICWRRLTGLARYGSTLFYRYQWLKAYFRRSRPTI